MTLEFFHYFLSRCCTLMHAVCHCILCSQEVMLLWGKAECCWFWLRTSCLCVYMCVHESMCISSVCVFYVLTTMPKVVSVFMVKTLCEIKNTSSAGVMCVGLTPQLSWASSSAEGDDIMMFTWCSLLCFIHWFLIFFWWVGIDRGLWSKPASEWAKGMEAPCTGHKKTKQAAIMDS